ncbi:restriction endonuclease subunit S [bacterium]|nr:restriction endonuclease subunit S [bacterium]
MNKKSKRTLTPKLRFPEFRKGAGWDQTKVQETIASVTPPKKLTTSDYLAKGRFPIIDQSQNYICGWTNDDKAVITSSLPVIVFGDHTCVLKLVAQPFVQGADGIKIFTAKHGISTEFLYHALSCRPLVMEDYKRHFSILKDRPIAFPDMNLGEQQKIAECLSSLDGLIAAEGRKLAALRDHKRGLMQQLFPQPGQSQPRLRFPEFRSSPEWEISQLGSVSDVRDGTHDSPKFFTSGRPLVTSKNLRPDGTLDLQNVSLISEEDYVKINKRSKVAVGDILFGMIGTIGNPVVIRSEGFAIKNVALIKQSGPLLNSFLVQLLHSQYVAAIFAVLNTGNSQKFIALGKIRSLLVPVPSLPEQQRIAECLSAIDDQVTVQAMKIDVLQIHKKGLMQHLFPVPEDN